MNEPLDKGDEAKSQTKTPGSWFGQDKQCLTSSPRGSSPMHDSRDVASSGRGLTVRRGTRTVFEDIQLNVDSGDCVILTGENGSGSQH